MKKYDTAVKILIVICVILTAALIYLFSAQNGTESANSSDRLIAFLAGIFARGSDTDVYIIKYTYIFRKMAHFTEFAILSSEIFSAVQLLPKKQIKLLWSFLPAVLMSALYACADEYHQLFIPGRSSSPKDILIDTAGAVFGALATALIFYLVRKNADHKK